MDPARRLDGDLLSLDPCEVGNAKLMFKTEEKCLLFSVFDLLQLDFLQGPGKCWLHPEHRSSSWRVLS